jgi:hypothetical protein
MILLDGTVMNTTSSASKIIVTALLCAFFAFIAAMLINAHLIARTDRIATYIQVMLATGEHEIVTALPKGMYTIRFTSDPKGGVSGVYPPANVLQAQISTRLLKETGEVLVGPTAAEHVTFRVSAADSFRPQKVLVSISGTQAVYVTLKATF